MHCYGCSLWRISALTATEALVIINVAAGDLSEDSTDAVNGSQLYGETNQRRIKTPYIADTIRPITNLSSDI